MRAIKYLKRIPLLALLAISLFIPTRVFAQGGLQNIIHSVHAEPIEGKVAYTVKVYFSVMDANGTPLKGLKIDNFLLSEDSQSLPIETVEPVANESTSLILVMDTSGSMLGQGIVDARNAAASFLERLGSNDQSAVIAFNDNISTVVDFTNDHLSSSEAVKQISAQNQAGTCLYDAAHQAIEMASTTPPGRRAVVVFTDGKDETLSGEKCSLHVLQDVVDLARSTGTPVYTLGMGSQIEENELKRLAATTGGTFLSSAKSSDLDATFTKLYEQLNNEYVLTYTSTGAPGPHTLAVEVSYRNQKDQATYTFNLPALPTTIAFNSPAEGESLAGKVTLKAKLLTQGAKISGIEFGYNGLIIGKDVSEPYELEWDVTNESAGEAQLEAVAIGKDGEELARTSISVNISENQPAPGEVKTDDTAGESTSSTSILQSKNAPLVYIGGGLLLFGLIVMIVLMVRKNKNKKPEEPDVFAPKSIDGQSDKTIDGISVSNFSSFNSEREIATLTVLSSDDPASVGHQYSISKLPMILGRSTEDADIVFSGKDQAISRRHASLEWYGNGIAIRDLNSSYGTFYMEQKIGDAPVQLNNGDEIRLGPRTRLRLDQIRQHDNSEKTFDGIDLGLTNEDTRDPM